MEYFVKPEYSAIREKGFCVLNAISLFTAKKESHFAQEDIR